MRDKVASCPPWLFNVYKDVIIKSENEDGEDRNKISGGGGERRVAGHLFTDNLILCREWKRN